MRFRRYGYCVTAASEIRPHDVERVLGGREASVLGAYVLVEAELAAGSQDAVEFGERCELVGDGAQHQRRDSDSKRGVLEWELVGDGVDHAYRRALRTRRRRLGRAGRA